eukprot:1616739-Amphidinium_carterae.1
MTPTSAMMNPQASLRAYQSFLNLESDNSNVSAPIFPSARSSDGLITVSTSLPLLTQHTQPKS